MAKTITLVDSGIETRGANAAPFDAEGVVSRRTPVVERGTLRHHLCDTYWARRTGRVSTANARRGSSQSPPSLSVSNLHIEPGPLTPAALLAECREGVFITEVIGLHTADPISGDFSLGAMGHAIVKGKPAGPVRGFGIAGNLARLFRDASAVGSDLRFMGAYGSPSLLVSEMHISGN